MIEPTYTVDQSAKILCCPRTKVYSLLKEGKLKQKYISKKIRVITESMLKEYLDGTEHNEEG